MSGAKLSTGRRSDARQSEDTEETRQAEKCTEVVHSLRGEWGGCPPTDAQFGVGRRRSTLQLANIFQKPA